MATKPYVENIFNCAEMNDGELKSLFLFFVVDVEDEIKIVKSVTADSETQMRFGKCSFDISY